MWLYPRMNYATELNRIFLFSKKDEKGRTPKALKRNSIMQMIMTLGSFF